MVLSTTTTIIIEGRKMEKPSRQEEGEVPWKHLTHQELEAQYSPSRWSKRFPESEVIGEHIRAASRIAEETKGKIGGRLDVAYGAGPRAKLDVYGEQLPPVGVGDIVEEVRAGIVWACKLARRRGSKGVVLAGWSAGGQLVTQVLSEEGSGGEGQSRVEVNPLCDLVRGVVTFSGVFDLRPLVTTYVNDPLKLSTAEAWALSPMGRVEQLGRAWGERGLRLLVVVGEHEPPEFIRQSKEYCKACVGAGLRAECEVVEDADHFNLVEDLSCEDHSFTRRMLDFVLSCTGRNHLKD